MDEHNLCYCRIINYHSYFDDKWTKTNSAQFASSKDFELDSKIITQYHPNEIIDKEKDNIT